LAKKEFTAGGSHNLFGKCNTEIAKQYSGGFSSHQIFDVKVLLKGLPNNIEDYPRPAVVKVLLKKKHPFRSAFRLAGELTSNA
jgi:hypothetical protein